MPDKTTKMLVANDFQGMRLSSFVFVCALEYIMYFKNNSNIGR